MPQINTQALDDALHRATVLVTVPDKVVAALRELVQTGTDQQLLLINPIKFALERHFELNDAITAFVGASKAGAFQFKWTLTCPMCGSYAHEGNELSAIGGTFYCAMCDRDSDTKMDSLVEVAFCVSDTVRHLPPKLTLPLEGAEWLDLFQNDAARLDPRVSEVLRRNMIWSGLVKGSSEQTVEVALTARKTRVASLTMGKRVSLRCPPDKAGAIVEIHADGVKLVEYTNAPRVVIRNVTGQSAVCVLSKDVVLEEDFTEMPDATNFDRLLSGRDLLCNQAFRDLYAAETLSAGIALHVESQTVLFTDLKGSTQLYDSIGDVRAFSLVSEHFKILLAAVQKCGGAVVKTIGDAVMATFPQTVDAVRAALQMAQALHGFNSSSSLPPLSLKIGLHVGPCMVVNSNGRPDYFGQTVNIAARVQGLAEGDELVLTDAARNAPGVAELLGEHRLTPQASEATLKGVAEKIKVHTVRV
jgi:class 3 adenylate cyclase